MNISELKDGMRGVSIVATVDSVSEPRTVNLRTGDSAQVADAVVSDDSGSIKVSLWDAQINMVKQGDKISVENGYVKSFRGENSLNVGKFGKLQKL